VLEHSAGADEKYGIMFVQRTIRAAILCARVTLQLPKLSTNMSDGECDLFAKLVCDTGRACRALATQTVAAKDHQRGLDSLKCALANTADADVPAITTLTQNTANAVDKCWAEELDKIKARIIDVTPPENVLSSENLLTDPALQKMIRDNPTRNDIAPSLEKATRHLKAIKGLTATPSKHMVGVSLRKSFAECNTWVRHGKTAVGLHFMITELDDPTKKDLRGQGKEDWVAFMMTKIKQKNVTLPQVFLDKLVELRREAALELRPPP